MKKSGILLLASLSLVLTSCGTTYKNASNEKAKLSLTSSSFVLSEKDEGTEEATLLTKSYEWSSVKVLKGEAVESEDREGVYTLTVTSITEQYVAEGEGAELAYDVYEIALKATGLWTSEEISKLLEGKKVSKKLDSDDQYDVKVTVDDEAKTWKYTL